MVKDLLLYDYVCMNGFVYVCGGMRVFDYVCV